MFFANVGEYEPSGMFTFSHLKLILLTMLAIIVAIKKTENKNEKDVKNIIKKLTILLWILEILKIIFRLKTENINDVNGYLPLYYCSIVLYAGILSSFAKGKLKRMGDVFLATGGIIGGVIFMIFPTTSLPYYPAFHFISLHSYFFHGTMVYIGILINKTCYVELYKNDIIYYASLVGVVCLAAYIVNKCCDSNLMFISKDFPGTIIDVIYKVTGPFYTVIMSLGQMILPFYAVYEFIKMRRENIWKKIINKKKLKTC